jgi:hypothetical protein
VVAVKKFRNKIQYIHLRGKEFNYDLDHMYYISDDFINKVSPEIVGHWRNLRVIKKEDNIKKLNNSCITLEDLILSIK